MKRCIAGMAVGILAIGLTGCSTVSVREEIRAGLTQRVEITMPEEYQITYERNNGDGTITQIICMKDADGNVYYQNGNEKMWFIYEEDGYVQMQSKINGILVPAEDGVTMPEDYVLAAASAFFQCVNDSSKSLAPEFEYVGEQKVAGRTCDVYENTMGTTNMNVAYIVLVDHETGICMGWQQEAETGVFETNVSVGTFICTEFITENVSLPEV